MIRDFRNLNVWNEAVELAIQVYAASQNFPQHELRGLTGQLRRAAVSIPCNIAQGRSRRFSSEFIQYLSIARGLLAEVQTYLGIAARLGYLSPQSEIDLNAQIEVIVGMLATLSISCGKEGLCQTVH